MSKRFKAKPEAFASKARNVFKKARGLFAVCAGAADHRKNCAEKEAGTGFRPWRSQTKDISLDLIKSTDV